MFERFTSSSRRVLVLAQEEARLLRHDFIGTEHILLGLVHEGESIAAASLEALGVSLPEAQTKVEEMVRRGGGEAPAGSPPFTPRAKKVLELALRQALHIGHSYIGPEHILLGIVAEGEGVGAMVLSDIAGSLSAVSDEVMRRVEPGAPSPRGRLRGRGRERAVVASTAGAPRCERCEAGLADSLRSQALVAGPQEPGEGAALSVVVLYCCSCGSTLGFLPAS
ncbi:MAG: Clp protease N-terminal domain-containing protein [Acidimicrobiales bacterium]